MSLGYAEKLSYREDLGGQLGAPEVFDDSHDLKHKIQQLTEWVCKNVLNWYNTVSSFNTKSTWLVLLDEKMEGRETQRDFC